MRNSQGTGFTRGEIQLKEIMQLDPITIDINATTADAAAAMCKNDVGSCIVLRGKSPVGMVTEQDFNCKVMAKNMLPGSVRVGDVMSSPLITVQEHMLTAEAAKIMIKHKVRRLPVTGADGNVTGIVTVRDLLGVTNELNEIMAELIAINRPDERTGRCAVCGMISGDLVPVDGMLVCPNCREQERI